MGSARGSGRSCRAHLSEIGRSIAMDALFYKEDQLKGEKTKIKVKYVAWIPAALAASIRVGATDPSK